MTPEILQMWCLKCRQQLHRQQEPSCEPGPLWLDHVKGPAVYAASGCVPELHLQKLRPPALVLAPGANA